MEWVTLEHYSAFLGLSFLHDLISQESYKQTFEEEEIIIHTLQETPGLPKH